MTRASLGRWIGPGRYWSCWALVIGVIVHLDWHLGRPHHIPLSLEFRQHWILGLITGLGLAWHATRIDPAHAVRRFALVGSLGLVAGQVLEPLAEVLIYDDLTVSAVYPVVRWRLFGQFAIAFVVGGAAVLIAHTRRMQNALLNTSIRSGHV